MYGDGMRELRDGLAIAAGILVAKRAIGLADSITVLSMLTRGGMVKG